MKEQIAKATAKIITWNKWIRGLIDAIIIGGITAGTGTFGLSIENAENLEWKTFFILVGTGVAGGILRYFAANPMAAIGSARLFLLTLVCFTMTGCTSLPRKVLTTTQEFEGSGSISITTRIGSASIVVENARKEGGMYRADKLHMVANEVISGTKTEIHAEPYARPLLIREKTN